MIWLRIPFLVIEFAPIVILSYTTLFLLPMKKMMKKPTNLASNSMCFFVYLEVFNLYEDLYQLVGIKTF